MPVLPFRPRRKKERKVDWLINILTPSSRIRTDAFRSLGLYYEYHQQARQGRELIADPQKLVSSLNLVTQFERRTSSLFHDPRFTRHLKTLSPEERNRVIGTYRGIRRLARVMREITAKSLTHHHQTPLVVNDSMFKARVYEALREPNHQPFSAIVIDLDRFGRINKRFGQKVGNVTLSRFTEMLSQVAAIGNGYAGRMGGDEYYLFFRKDPATAFTLIKMLQENYLRDTDSPEFRDEVMELSKRWRKGKQDQHWWKKLSKNMGLEFVKGLLAQRRWKPISFTAAVIGTSSYDKKVDYDDLFDELDRRMQKQKRRRRGKVVQIALNRSRKE